MSLKIFVTGASGYIGQAVAIGLRRAGHQVYGLVRDQAKGHHLALNEVNVVVGDILKVDSYRRVAEECSVIIHTAVDYGNYEHFDTTVLNTFLEISKLHPKKLLIWTSGILVYQGSDAIITELDRTDVEGGGFLPSRIRNELTLLQSHEVSPVVIRPAYVFGGTRGHFYDYFRQAEAGKVVIAGRSDVGWSEVHIDDLVNGYIAIVHAPVSTVAHQIFNFADSSRNTNLAIATAFAKTAGFTGAIESGGPGAWPQSQKMVMVSSEKARRLLGWVPQHQLLLDEVPIYYKLWKAMETPKK